MKDYELANLLGELAQREALRHYEARMVNYLLQLNLKNKPFTDGERLAALRILDAYPAMEAATHHA